MQHPCEFSRIIESLRSEKTSKVSKSNCQPTPPCLLNHVLKRHIYTFFGHLQGWGLHHFPGQPVPVPDHSFSKDILLCSFCTPAPAAPCHTTGFSLATGSIILPRDSRNFPASREKNASNDNLGRQQQHPAPQLHACWPPRLR